VKQCIEQLKILECVVKQCIEQLKLPLTNIYNTSLESGIFPDKLKIAKVIPVHKKGDSRDVSNYRPISLLPVFSKLLEKLMYNRLAEFIERNEVLTEAQHGFRTKKSANGFTDFYKKHPGSNREKNEPNWNFFRPY